MKLYNDNGYPNTDIWHLPQYPIVLIWGARGIGKTVTGLLDEFKRGEIFLYLRRKQQQADLCMMPELSPIKTINKIALTSYVPARIAKNYGAVYNGEEKENKLKPYGKPIAYIAALSTFADVRGAGLEDVKTMIYDEYSGEKNDRAIKGEESLILNAYETINRNREIDEENPQPPLRAIFMSNSNDFINPVFSAFNVTDIAEKMAREKKSLVTLPERGIILINYLNSPISQKKNNTALYKATANEEFKKMALENDFNFDTNIKIKPRNIAHAKPLVTFGDYTLYDIDNVLYFDERKSGTPPIFTTDKKGIAQFMRNFPNLYYRILRGKAEYQNYTVYGKVKAALL